MLLTVFLPLLTIVSIDFFSEMTGYYIETLGRLIFPLTSHPQRHDVLSVVLYHYSNSLFILKDDAYAISHSPAQTIIRQVRPYLCLTKK